MPGEFSLTNDFLFIGKKSCSGDKLLTKRKRRFCWEQILILDALTGSVSNSLLPPLLSFSPPPPFLSGFIDSCWLPLTPSPPTGFSALPSGATVARSQLPVWGPAETDLCGISGQERQLPTELLFWGGFLFSLEPCLPSPTITQAGKGPEPGPGVSLGLTLPGGEPPKPR